MKLNISYPATGCQKIIEIDDEKKLRAFYDKRMSQEVDGDVLGDEFKGYIFRISGGNDKEGFPMKQGVLTNQRVRILFSKGHSCFRERRKGERKRKSIRGCIVGVDLVVLNLVIVKKGDADISGLTDTVKPSRLGPKRASRIRKLFNLSKEDDVRQYVVKRTINKDGKKPYTKSPKIQRLVTPQRLQHRRQLLADKRKWYEKSRKEAQEYNLLLAKFNKQQREQESLLKKRSLSRRESAKREVSTGKKAKADKKKTEKKSKKDDKKNAKPAAAAPAKKDEKKEAKPAAAAPAAAKKDEKKDSKPAKKDEKKDSKPAAAPAAKKDEKKPAAAKKDEKKDSKPAAAAAPAKKDAKKPAAAPTPAPAKKEAKPAAAAPAKKDEKKAATAAPAKKETKPAQPKSKKQ